MSYLETVLQEKVTMPRKMRQPNERRLTSLYGKNDAKKKAYRRGWNMVGQRLADERASKRSKQETK